MFSFASKMLNSLIGEGEQPPRPQGPRPPLQPGPGMPPYTRPVRPQAPIYRGNGQEMNRPRLAVLGRNPSQIQQQQQQLQQQQQHQQPPLPRKEGGLEEPNLDLSHLSAEERAMIQNVMQKAKTLEDGPKLDPGINAAIRNRQDAVRLAQAHGAGAQAVGPRPGMYSPFGAPQDNVRVIQQHGATQAVTGTQPHGGMQQRPDVHQLQNVQQHDNSQIHTTTSLQQRTGPLQNQNRHDPYNQGLRTDLYNRQDEYHENTQSADDYHRQNGFRRQNDFSAQGYVQQRNDYGQDNFTDSYPNRTEPNPVPEVTDRQPSDYRQTQEQVRQEAQVRQEQFRPNVLQEHQPVSHRTEPYRQDMIQDQIVRQEMQSNQFLQENTAVQDQLQANRQQEVQSRNQQIIQEEAAASQRQQHQYSGNNNKEFQLSRQDSYKQNNAYINSACWERSEKQEEEVQQERGEDPAAPKDEIKPPSLIESFYDHSPGQVYTIPEEEDELSSPTGGDGVTSLRKQRLAAGATPTSKSSKEEEETSTGSDSQMKTKNNFLQSSSKSFNDTSLMGQSTSLQDRELDNLNGYNMNCQDTQYGRSTQRKGENVQNDLSKRLAGLGIGDNLKHLSMKTELEGPSAKSPLSTHKWATPDQQQYEKPPEPEDHNRSYDYLQNDKPIDSPHMDQMHDNRVPPVERHPEPMHNNRPSICDETVPQAYSPKPQSPVQRSPQPFHTRPKTQFPPKSNHVDTGIVSKEETWKSPMVMQDETRYQQMVHQEYPMDTLMYHNRGKPRPLLLQGDFQEELSKQNMQRQGNPSTQTAQPQTGKPSAGTISGMLADFSRALGLSSTVSPSRPSPSDDMANDNQLPYQDSQDHTQQYQRPLSQQQIQAQIKSNEQFMHGSQNRTEKTSMHQYPQSQFAYDNKGLITGDIKTDDPYSQQQKAYGMQQSLQGAHQMLIQQQGQMTGQEYCYGQEQQINRMQQVQQPSLQQANTYQQQLIQQQLQQQQLQQQKQVHMQQSLQGQVQRANDYSQLAHMSDPDQNQIYQQQQLYQKLGEYQPVFAQNLTPQQQQMYQQHMQLQHHAQHLKKIRRSNLDTRGQPQFQKKDNILNLIGQSTAVGSGVTLQQLGAAQLVNQQTGNVQLLNSQHLSNYISAEKLNALSRPTAVSSQPVIVTTSYGNQQVNSVTPLGTPQSTPVGTPRGPRDGGDSSDTMSETDSQKSLRTRRKLPSIPTDQEAVTLPSAKKRDRGKIKSPHDRFSPSCSPLRQFGDGGYRIASNLMLQRPSASETNLRKVSHGPEQIPRPGSALGLLQGSSVVSSGLRSDYSKEAEIASCLPPDLRHLLSSYKGDSSHYSTNKSLILQTYKDSLSSEMKISAADRRALGRLSDWDSERLLERNKELLRSPKSRFDIQRKIAFSGLGRQRKLRAHRRQLSDPKLHLDVHPMKDAGESSYTRGYLGIGPPNLRPPYKSYEYESIDDGKGLDWDHSQPYLSSYAMAGGALRETAINSVLDSEHYSNDPSRFWSSFYASKFTRSS